MYCAYVWLLVCAGAGVRDCGSMSESECKVAAVCECVGVCATAGVCNCVPGCWSVWMGVRVLVDSSVCAAGGA